MKKIVTFLSLLSILCTVHALETPRKNLREMGLVNSTLQSAYKTYADTNCSRQISQYVNQYISVSGLLQSCLDSAAENSRILLAPGKYILTEAINLKKSVFIGTLGLDPSTDLPCDKNDSSLCATFLLSAPISKKPGVQGVIHIAAKNVVLNHIVVDGDRTNPFRTVYDLCRKPEYRPQANSITVDGTGLIIANSVIRNTPCSTGTEVRGSAVGLNFINNYVASNGTHNEDMMWADGLTVHTSANAIVSGNIFFNNTDVDLIFGGCQNCLIQKNIIFHDDQFAGSSFVGLMIHSWNPQNGDYRGSLVSENTIDCGLKKRCGFGLYLGSASWYDQPMFGGEYKNNKISNTMLGLNIDVATGPVQVHNNTILNSGGGQFFTNCGMKKMSAVNISPDSQKNVSYSGSTKDVSNVSYRRCLPNWWTKDMSGEIKNDPVRETPSIPVLNSVTTAICDSASQPAPHWGIKNNQCLRSCGALGGTAALTNACSKHNMKDVGVAYDTQFCCTK